MMYLLKGEINSMKSFNECIQDAIRESDRETAKDYIQELEEDIREIEIRSEYESISGESLLKIINKQQNLIKLLSNNI
jgi:hypothetical protein